MSYAPETLLQVREYLHQQTGLPYAALGIVGDSSHVYGYHLGKDRIKPGDYSVRLARDVNGLSNAASALDVGSFPRLVQLTAWMVGQARANRRPDTREIIGPGGDGRAYRWPVDGGWRAERRADGDSHESHVHESFFRDSESRGKIRFFRGFFEEVAVGDVYYRVNSSDPEYHNTYWTSNRIHRRKLRKAGNVLQRAIEGAEEVVLTDALRGTEAWATYLDGVAGPLFPALVCNCNGGGSGDHTHTVTGSTGPVDPGA